MSLLDKEENQKGATKIKQGSKREEIQEILN